MRHPGTAVQDHVNDILSKQNKNVQEDGFDADSVTEKCTVASASSDDSFGAEFALSTIRHSVVGKFKSSARGLARKSSARISPLLQRSNAIAFKPRPRRERAPLTIQQLEARKRREDNIAKVYRMLQRINQDPFVASRVILAFSALLLVLRPSDSPLASCLSLTSVLLLHQTTQLASTATLQAWYYIGVTSLFVSASSWIMFNLFQNIHCNWRESTLETLPYNYWLWAQIIPRLWGMLLALWLYRDVAGSKNSDDNAIDTIQIKASILGIKFFEEANGSAFRRPKWKNSVIAVQHGTATLGEISTRQLLDDATGASTFRTTAFSHFLESVKGSSMMFHLTQGDETAEVAKVPIPTIHNMKMTNWFPIVDSDEKKFGELLVQIQCRPLAVPFLFRASTILPIVACFVVATCCWT